MQETKTMRRVKEVWESYPTLEGAGVHLRRVFGYHQTPKLDPFLLLDDFRSENPEDYKAGFPWHPHRGIETITYVLEGDVEHGDSLGNKGIISSGDVQWMTSGSGIIHQEMPKGNSKGKMFGFQLWANLPRAKKMIDPNYQEVKQKAIPLVKTEHGAEVRIICGEVQSVKGPVQGIAIDPEYLDVYLPKGKSFVHEIPKGHTAFAYVIEGKASFEPEKDPIERNHLVLFGDGNKIEVIADKHDVRFLFIAGKPIREPIAWYGPIVMNTRQELVEAFREYEEGCFVKRR
jgi:redox-sensitive bicupin YhaK (pirin superfamily)